MAVADNRITVGIGAQTPRGIWYDAHYVPKEIVYLAAYGTWNNPATGTPVAFDNLKDAEEAFFPVYRDFYGLAKANPLVSNTPVVNHNLLTHSRLASRSPLELSFDPEERGKTVYLAARWQNRRGELGPWSDIISAIIP
jgi:hypothetical protein